MPPHIRHGKFAGAVGCLSNLSNGPKVTVRIPITRRDAPIFNTSPMVGRLVAACVIIHIVVILLPVPVTMDLIERFSFISARYTFDGGWQVDPIAYGLGPFTHMFLHGGFIHLLLNMAMLLAFGTPIERRMSAPSFSVLYVICGLAGALLWALFNPVAITPLIGASGAISGMVGAVGWISLTGGTNNGMPFHNRSAALVFVVLWLIFNFVFGIIGLALFGMEGDVAWEAHLGGFIAGFLLIGFFTRKKRPAAGL